MIIYYNRTGCALVIKRTYSCVSTDNPYIDISMAALVSAATAGPARPSTVFYRDHCTDANNNVFGGEYIALLAPYVNSIGIALAHNPQHCRTLAFDARSQGVPTAFMLQHNEGNKLHIYLQLDRVTAKMGMATTG